MTCETVLELTRLVRGLPLTYVVKIQNQISRPSAQRRGLQSFGNASTHHHAPNEVKYIDSFY